ncbi:hypothetical protein [Nocardia tengchongensis]|uniref:hypothetical protein n=1 Tax=Nocardia tengchongensis TaxID=2055889 RepID=UPI0036C96145
MPPNWNASTPRRPVPPRTDGCAHCGHRCGRAHRPGRRAAGSPALAADGLKRLSGRATSPDHTITAEVAGDGALTARWLSEQITTRPPRQAAHDITETIAPKRDAPLARLSEYL